MRRIVFPALGTGRCRYKNEDIATAICEASMCFEMKFPMSSLRQVTIAIPDNEAHYVSSFYCLLHCGDKIHVSEQL